MTRPRHHEPADEPADDGPSAAEATVLFRSGHRGDAARVQGSIERRGAEPEEVQLGPSGDGPNDQPNRP